MRTRFGRGGAPGSWIRFLRFMALRWLRRCRARVHDEALALAEDIMAVEPGFSVVHETRGRVLLHTGKYQLAVDALEKNLELSGRNAVALALLGYAYARLHRPDDAGRILRELETSRQTGYTSGTALAILQAGLGDTTQAFQWLLRRWRKRTHFWCISSWSIPSCRD